MHRDSWTLSVAFLLTTLTALPAPATGPWVRQFPHPTERPMHAVSALDVNTAVFAGAGGTVVWTTDGGTTWTVTEQVGPAATDLTAAELFDTVTALVMGRGGVAFRTTNAGQSWVPISTGVTSDIEALAFANGSAGVAVGRNGVTLASADGGASWTAGTSPAGDYLDVCAIDANRFVAVGVGGGIVRTEDGGATWTSQTSGTGLDLHTVDFLDSAHGLAGGNEMTLLTTSDGGVTWGPIPSPTGSFYCQASSETIHQVHFIDDMTQVAFSECEDFAGFLNRLETTDGGVSWTHEVLGPAVVADQIDFVDNANAFATGHWSNGWASGSRLLKTGDAGNTWATLGNGENATLTGIDLFDAQTGMAVARGGSRFSSTWVHTTINGEAWTPNWFAPDFHFTSIAYTGPTTIYGAGIGFTDLDIYGSIYKSTDGGASWTVLWSAMCPPGMECDTPGIFYDICMTEPGWGVGVGRPFIGFATPPKTYGVVILQNDVPTAVESGVPETLYGVSMIDRNNGWTVGENGVILRTITGGTFWFPEVSGTTEQLNGVLALSSGTVYAVGAGGTILQRAGTGDWFTLQSGTTEDLHGVTFGDDANGVVVGDNGTVLKTATYGALWTQETTPTTESLRDVDWVPGRITAVGTNQIIISQTGAPVPILISRFEATPEPFCVTLSWRVAADEPIAHYRVYRRRDGATSVVIADAVSPSADVYVDKTVVPDSRYTYQISAVRTDDNEVLSYPLPVQTPAATVSLAQNHPNPFNPTTTIGFTLTSRVHATLSVYDVGGRRVATLIDRVLPTGQHQSSWDGRTANGFPAGSGVYFYRLSAGTRVLTRKMVLLK